MEVTAHEGAPCSVSMGVCVWGGGVWDWQMELLEDKLFWHLPRKLWSSKVAIGSCLLVDWPLQLQIPANITKGCNFS